MLCAFTVKHSDGTSVTQAQEITLKLCNTNTTAYDFNTNSSGTVTKSISIGQYDIYVNGGCIVPDVSFPPSPVASPWVDSSHIELDSACAI
jgi:hypothetical protein